MRSLLTRPRGQMALKASAAAAVAWQVALLVPGPPQRYPYYAPLGAVLAIYPTVAKSFRESLQAIAAIGLGAALALLAGAVSEPNSLTIAGVVAAGVVLGGLAWLGASRSWVPVAALFVLIVGAGETTAYTFGYLAQTLIGAAIGLAVNALLPPLPLGAYGRELDQAAGAISAQLRVAADLIRNQRTPDLQRADVRNVELSGMALQTYNDLHQINESLRGNVRARHHREEIEHQRRRALRLNRTALVAQELISLLEAVDIHGEPRVSLGDHGRAQAVETVEMVALAVERLAGSAPGGEQLARIDEAIEALTKVMAGDDPGSARSGSEALLTTLRRCRDVLAM